MAKIGMTNVMASLIREDENTASHKGVIKYYAEMYPNIDAALEASTFPHARRGNVTYNWAEGQLYGDDILAEKWKYLIDADIELELTELEKWYYSTPQSVVSSLGVDKVKDDMGANTLFTLRTMATGKLDAGFGFIQTLLINGVKKHRALFFPRVTFHIETEETMTKEEAIQWGCPILRGKAKRVLLADATDPTGYSEQVVVSSEILTNFELVQTWLLDQLIQAEKEVAEENSGGTVLTPDING